jgi:hypothetical protein
MIGSTAILTWLMTGVPTAVVARFIAFEALYVLLPGCMLYAILSRPTGGWLYVLAIGWPLGCAIEIGVFAATAALGRREWFRFLPVAAAVTLGPPLARAYGRSCARTIREVLARRPREERRRERGLPLLVLGLSVTFVVSLLALRYFAHYPLPGASSVSYLPDNVFAMSIAAEARDHWPITAPYVAGQPLHFYPGVFIHIAAISQATGIASSSVVLRLLPTTLITVIALQLWLLCRQLGGSVWTGVAAIVLFFLVGELSLDATRFETFGVNFFDMLSEGSNNTLGMCFFLAMLIAVQRQIAVHTRTHDTTAFLPKLPVQTGVVGALAIMAILALGAGWVKTMLVADVFGGLVVFLLVSRFAAVPRKAATARTVASRSSSELVLWVYAAISLLSLGVVYFSTLAGGLSPYRIEPFAFVHFSVFAPFYPAHTVVRFALLAGAAVLASGFLFVPLAGAVWLLQRRSANVPFVAFATGVFMVGLAAYCVLAGPGDNEIDFLTYGYLAIIPLSALGLTRLWARTPETARRKTLRACLGVFALGMVAAAFSQVLTTNGILAKASAITSAEPLLGPKRLALAGWYIAIYGGIASALVVAAFKFEKYFLPVARTRAGRMLACGIPMVLTLGLVKPVGVAVPELYKLVAGKRIVVRDSSEDQGLSAALYSGLLWVRSHTTSRDVLAVNNHYLQAHSRDPRYFYYSAFTERRVFLESWAYPAHWSRPQPFPGRLALSERVTAGGDPSALRELERKGVSYVLIDKTHGSGASEPADVSTLVFSNSALNVYRLVRPAGSQGTARRNAGARV